MGELGVKLKIWELCVNIHGCTYADAKLDEKDLQLIDLISFLGGFHTLLYTWCVDI